MLRKLIPFLTSVWLIASVACVARAGFVWDQQRKIPHQALAAVPFDNEAGNIANALAQGRGFSDVFRKPTGATAWLAPVYPLILSAIFRICGAFTYPAFLAAVLLNCAFSAATTFPLFHSARRIAGFPAAAVAAWLWALYPNGIILPFEWVWDTSLSALLMTTILWATIALTTTQRRRDWLAYGALWGVALLTNPSVGILLPVFLLWLALRGRPDANSYSKLACAAFLVAIAVCLPWTIRNYSKFHRVIPLRSNFAFELWIGNNDIFDEHAVGGIQRITRFGEVRLYTQLGETAFMDEKRRLAFEFLRTHRALALRLTARRIVATWLGTEHPWRDFWATDEWLVRTIFIFNAFTALATICGIAILLWRKNPFAIPVAAIPVLFPLVYYATHTSLRYRHPIDPVLLLLVAAAIVTIGRTRPDTIAPPAR
jgi:4-amino-4-deoxy-L-arabinose transferase-like glycosyltransferase